MNEKLDVLSQMNITYRRATVENLLPSVGVDLMEYEDNFKHLPDGRTHVVLEMLRHGDVTLDKAAEYLGIQSPELSKVLAKLPIPELNRYALNA